ncbi:unnamed protein product, partial [Ectocarpus sp. 6 AP-2014]
NVPWCVNTFQRERMDMLHLQGKPYLHALSLVAPRFGTAQQQWLRTMQTLSVACCSFYETRLGAYQQRRTRQGRAVLACVLWSMQRG